MRVIPLFIALALVIGSPPAPAASQDVQYETLTRLDLPGALGTVVRIAARMGGGSMETVETTYIKGGRMRTDMEGSSTITDMENRRIILLDHRERTYQTLGLDQAVAMAEQAGAHIREAQAEGAPAEDLEGRVEFRFSVDRTGERQRIDGHDAERVFLTIEAEGEYVPEEGEEMEEAGTLVVLTELWVSTDHPAHQARSRFDELSARHFSEAGASITESLAAVFAENPSMRVALDKSAAEVENIQGMPVRIVSTLVGVAPGETFDRSKVTDPQPAGGGARGALGRLGRAAAAAAAGQAAGGQDRPQATQSVILSVKSDVRNVATRALDASLFEIPDGYRQVELQH
jgi:hypothetical protein